MCADVTSSGTLLLGFTYYLAVVNIPQRLQIVSGSSPIIAGLQMLPFLVFSAVGSVIGGALSRKNKYTGQTLVVAQAFALLGYGLMTTLGSSRDVPAKLYGFEILIGLENGIGIVCLTRLMESAVEPRWIGTYCLYNFRVIADRRQLSRKVRSRK